MVLTEKDLMPKKPIIKRPRSFNPIGAILTGLSLGCAHSILYRSFWDQTIHYGFSVFGFLLTFLAAGLFYFSISLTAKYIAFILRVEENKTRSALLAQQSLLAYLGFVPAYGFALIYSTQGLKIPSLIITMLAFTLVFAIVLYKNFEYLVVNKISLGYLLQWKYQPNNKILALVSIASMTVITVVFFVANLI